MSPPNLDFEQQSERELLLMIHGHGINEADCLDTSHWLALFDDSEQLRNHKHGYIHCHLIHSKRKKTWIRKTVAWVP